MRKVKRVYRSIRKGTKNLIQWFPIIWSDRDWDYEYLYQVLHKKLDNMDKFYRSGKTMSVEAKDIAEEIKEAKDLLANFLNSVHTNAIERYDENNLVTGDVDGKKLWKMIKDTDYERYINELRVAEKQEEEDLKKSLMIIADKSRGWWD